jgi:hypothetical protein
MGDAVSITNRSGRIPRAFDAAPEPAERTQSVHVGTRKMVTYA